MAKKDKILIDYFQHKEMLEAVTDLISQDIKAFFTIILYEYLEDIEIDIGETKKVPPTLSLMMALAVFHDKLENESENILIFFAENRQKIDNIIFQQFNKIRSKNAGRLHG
jgi:hypothetical protein